MLKYFFRWQVPWQDLEAKEQNLYGPRLSFSNICRSKKILLNAFAPFSSEKLVQTANGETSNHLKSYLYGCRLATNVWETEPRRQRRIDAEM